MLLNNTTKTTYSKVQPTTDLSTLSGTLSLFKHQFHESTLVSSTISSPSLTLLLKIRSFLDCDQSITHQVCD